VKPPFSKVVGIVVTIAGAILALDPALMTPFLGVSMAGKIVALSLLIVGLSHSFTGTGGKPTDP